jgi:hypothetical protein
MVDLVALMVLFRGFMFVQLSITLRTHKNDFKLSGAHGTTLIHLVVTRFFFGFGFNGELLWLVTRLAPQIVHARLQPLGPRVKVHGR